MVIFYFALRDVFASLQDYFSSGAKLDDNIGDVISQVSPFFSNFIWLGKVNYLGSRLALNGEIDPAIMQGAKRLEHWQADGNIKQLYGQFRNNPKIKWKESIKKVLGINIPVVTG